MTEDQKELREERTAIMKVEGATEEEIEKCLNSYPWLYGGNEKEFTQGSLL